MDTETFMKLMSSVSMIIRDCPNCNKPTYTVIPTYSQNNKSEQFMTCKQCSAGLHMTVNIKVNLIGNKKEGK